MSEQDSEESAGVASMECEQGDERTSKAAKTQPDAPETECTSLRKSKRHTRQTKEEEQESEEAEEEKDVEAEMVVDIETCESPEPQQPAHDTMEVDESGTGEADSEKSSGKSEEEHEEEHEEGSGRRELRQRAAKTQPAPSAPTRTQPSKRRSMAEPIEYLNQRIQTLIQRFKK